MTSYEHFMLGVNGTLAAGLHRRYGWSLAALAGTAAVLPDWDGLSLALGAAAFDRVHRVWGHNLFAAVVLGGIVAALEYRLGWLAKGVRWLSTQLKSPDSREACRSLARRTPGGWAVWISVGVVASLSHIGTDMLFSGHETLTDWGIQLFWPFSDRAWVYPVVRWGDPTVTILFALGMLAMAYRPQYVQRTAITTLILIAAYMTVRGWLIV